MNKIAETNQKKVLMIGMTTNLGGTERYIMNLFMGLNHEICQVDFLNQESGVSIACEEQIRRQGGNIVHAVKRTGHFLRHYYEITKLFHNKYDVIYYNTNDLANVDFLIFAKLFNRDAVKIIHAHNSQGASQGLRHIAMRFHQKIIRNITDKRYACSKTAGDWMFAGASYTVINNMIDLNRFHFDSDKKMNMIKKLGLEGKMIWGTVGRLCEQKNPLFLVEIMKYACKISKDIIFIHIGDGDLKNEMISRIKEYGLENNYILLGERNNVEEYYQIMEKFVFPSLWEGFGFSVIEAQAMGIQCIVTDNADVSKESDMKAGLIAWTSLDRGPEQWAKVIYNMPCIPDNSRSKYGQYIKQEGFSLKDNIEGICEF